MNGSGWGCAAALHKPRTFHFKVKVTSFETFTLKVHRLHFQFVSHVFFYHIASSVSKDLPDKRFREHRDSKSLRVQRSAGGCSICSLQLHTRLNSTCWQRYWSDPRSVQSCAAARTQKCLKEALFTLSVADFCERKLIRRRWGLTRWTRGHSRKLK